MKDSKGLSGILNKIYRLGKENRFTLRYAGKASGMNNTEILNKEKGKKDSRESFFL